MISVIILAGGKGTRMKHDVAKQHLTIKNKQIIEYTLSVFSKIERIDRIVVVSSKEYIDIVNSLKSKYPKLKIVCTGGETRSMSVFNGIKAIETDTKSEDLVLFSDAVRPCVTIKEINDLIDSLKHYSAVTTGLDCYETILKTSDGFVKEIIDRKGLIRQTSPEGYKFDVLQKIYLDVSEETIKKYKNIGIDQLIEQGYQIGVVHSNPLNFKITTQSDLKIFEAIVEKGFDDLYND